jgi:hypothetical protein
MEIVDHTTLRREVCQDLKEQLELLDLPVPTEYPVLLVQLDQLVMLVL